MCAEWWAEMDSQVTTPFSYCPSTVFLPVHSHCANARWNNVATNQHYLLKKILTASSLGELEETTKTPRTMWMKTIQQDLKSPWMKQLTWLRIVHSGDWCLRLVLHTPSGACRNEKEEWKDTIYQVLQLLRRWGECFQPWCLDEWHCDCEWTPVQNTSDNRCKKSVTHWVVVPAHV